MSTRVHPVCECCLTQLTTGEDELCREQHGDHVTQLCQWGLEPNEYVALAFKGVGDMIRCFGCGDDDIRAGSVLVVSSAVADDMADARREKAIERRDDFDSNWRS